ncbi:unnamed protein product [Bursaphelenchus xylophilus]|uniref:(pine wood nematode) hypothetical protein n=1 Tax=Bursaphelenchus xylophilus TaxID=6326 RepID=A0A1I7RMM2_BURXY|nr:unnamed protein product [Bursaphelenchus xylophilus]CAG9125677.1 unnamed protein product [Bursaphelenchus xylophilus]
MGLFFLLLAHFISNVRCYILNPYGYPCSAYQLCPQSWSGYDNNGASYTYQPSYPGGHPWSNPNGYPFSPRRRLTSCPFPYNSDCLYGSGFYPGASYGYIPIPGPSNIIVVECATCPSSPSTTPVLTTTLPSTTSSTSPWTTSTTTMPTTTTGLYKYFYCSGEVNNIVAEGKVYTPGCLKNGSTTVRVSLLCPKTLQVIPIGAVVPVGCLW